MARPTTVGSVTGALIDSMGVVSNVAGIISDSVDSLRIASEGLQAKAIVFRDAAKIDAKIELGKMLDEKKTMAALDMAKQKAEVKRLLETDSHLAEAWDECKADVDSWFN